MANAGKANVVAIHADPVVDFEVTSSHPNFDSETGDGKNAMPTDWRFAGSEVLL
jgi:hypothetical protein